MPEQQTFSYYQLTHWREECHQRFGSIHHLPLIAWGQELQSLLKKDSRVLDIGAGVKKPLQKTIKDARQRYYSLDNDQAGRFDFCSFDDIPPDLQFDVMVANQVLEHLTINDAFDMVSSGYQKLVEGGCFLATVPNPAHPVRYWADVTHITHWPFNDLYGLFRTAGYSVRTLARYNKTALTHNPIKRMVTNIVCESFRIDWCDSLLIVGQKKSQKSER